MMYRTFQRFTERFGLDGLFGCLTACCRTAAKRYKIVSLGRKWARQNRHNHTCAGNGLSDHLFPIDRVRVGRATYGSLRVYYYDPRKGNESLTIGSYCSIANGVRFVLGGMHRCDTFSTYPFKAFLEGETETFSKGPVVVEDDVWIGADALIMQGVTLARGTVVAAGSVVVKSTEPYSIVGGNPAKLIRKRFDDRTIDRLLRIDLSGLSPEYIRKNMELLYLSLNPGVLRQIEETFGAGRSHNRE